jgi:hypothetical protein
VRLEERLSAGADDPVAHEHDAGRRRYLKSNFDREIDDPLLYHAVLNTGLLGLAETADALAAMLGPKLQRG